MTGGLSPPPDRNDYGRLGRMHWLTGPDAPARLVLFHTHDQDVNVLRGIEPVAPA
jgi:hypothetical protein